MKLTAKQKASLVNDLCDFRVDIEALLARHGISRLQLAQWMQTRETQVTLAGLCMVADYQAQLMASQYRVTALSRLVELATQKEEIDAEEDASQRRSRSAQREVTRKACVDLLKADMHRIDPVTVQALGESMLPAEAIRKLVYPNPGAE